jgi:hypothetical protein
MSVQAYSSFSYAVEPRTFEYGDTTHRVETITRMWRTPAQLHFYVRDEHEKFFELTYDEASMAWTIRTFGDTCPPKHS